MKKLLSMMLAIMLAVLSMSAIAETIPADGEEELLDQYVSELKDSDEFFSIPIRFGIIYSVALYRNGVGIVFQPVTNKAASLGMRSLSFLVDVKEIRLNLANGKKITMPAVIEIKHYDVGTFVMLNLTLDSVKTITKLVSEQSEVQSVTFIQSDRSEQEWTVEELNQALSVFYGTTVEFANQIVTAVGTFWSHLSGGVSDIASNTYKTVEDAVIKAGDFAVDTWDHAGQTVRDAAEKTGEAVSGTLESAEKWIVDAADSVKDFWNSLWGQ